MQTITSNNTKCRKNIRYVLATGFVLATISTATFAEERVINESLVYKDPTVAHQNQMVKGISLDYFSFTQNSTSPNPPYPDITLTQSYQQPGISGFVGYGDFTLMASYRSGTGTADAVAPFDYLGTTYTVNANDSYTVSEYEMDLRWLMTNYQTAYFTPYALIGYVGQAMNQTITVTFHGSTLSTTSEDITASAPLFGVGGIIPISEKIGFRIDDKFGFVTAKSGGTSSTYNVNRLTATMYYNFAASWNAQLGSRYESYSDGSPSISGGYAMLGYTFR